MTSGIYNYSDGLNHRNMNAAQLQHEWAPFELIRYAYAQPDYFNPGSHWHYSNTNYLIAGLILERVSHQSVETVLNTRFIHKYKLTHTYYFDHAYPADILKQTAHGYDGDTDVTCWTPSYFGAAGGMLSSSVDILKWTQLLLGGKVLPPKQQQEFMTTVPFPDHPPKPPGARFGLGIYFYQSPTLGPMWWYSGVTAGYVSLLVWMPQAKLSFAADINRIPAKAKMYGLLMPGQAFATQVAETLIHPPKPLPKKATIHSAMRSRSQIHLSLPPKASLASL
jgi:D-alanyl-D-alanine carboxypeptidase